MIRTFVKCRSHVRFSCPRASFSFAGRFSSLPPSDNELFTAFRRGKRKRNRLLPSRWDRRAHARTRRSSLWGTAEGSPRMWRDRRTTSHATSLRLAGPFRAFLRLFSCPTFGARSNVARHAINVWRGRVSGEESWPTATEARASIRIAIENPVPNVP